MSRTDIWNVALPVPLRKTFAYTVAPDGPIPAPGMRVLVPFGRRRMTGYLLEPADETELGGFTLKSIIRILDDTPAIPEELLSFLRMAADYYMHPLGEVLRTALPPGIDPTEKKGQLREARIREKTDRQIRPLPAATQQLAKIQSSAPRRGAVLRRILSAEDILLSDLRRDLRDATKHVNRLEQDALVETTVVTVSADPFAGRVEPRDTPPVLLDEQEHAVHAIRKQLDTGDYGGFLLHGITGSGKTEVYLHAIDSVLQKGKGAIVLVPEITLTPQLVRRYRQRFGEKMAIWHSGLTDRERFEQWRLLRSGSVRVAIGVRSAVFAPVQDLGIIVVDEEHDGSFKQERGFPYNGRDLSLLRAHRSKAIAILGSATPSLETYQNSQTGKLTPLTLTKRPSQKPLPEIEVINLANHRSGPGNQQTISGPLHHAIRDALEKKEQTILFLNRRGFAPNLLCDSCHEIVRCDDCAVSMTYHARPPSLTCHYCGASRPIPRTCPACGGAPMKPLGTGTQKVEDILADLFPDARVGRLDRDIASGNKAERILGKLMKGELDILVGTQMVTKGHDFPMVTTVGVLLGDVGLHMPDFRAAERTFQLLTQVAGRAGRAELNGRAIIQTYSPEHHAVALARTHDYISFARTESAAREELGYPPFGKLAAIRLSSPTEVKVESAARELMASIRDAWHNCGQPPVSMLGPAPAPIPFLQNRHRWRIMLRAKRQDHIRLVLNQVISKIESPSKDVRIRLDIDPVSML